MYTHRHAFIHARAHTHTHTYIQNNLILCCPKVKLQSTSGFTERLSTDLSAVNSPGLECQYSATLDFLSHCLYSVLRDLLNVMQEIV